MWRRCIWARCTTARSLTGLPPWKSSLPCGGQLSPQRRGARRRPLASQTSQTPYARVGEDGVDYAGPHREDVPAGPVSVVLFGPQAAEVAASPEMQAELAFGAAKGPAVEAAARRERSELGRGLNRNWFMR